MSKFFVTEEKRHFCFNVLCAERRIIRTPVFKVVKGFRRRGSPKMYFGIIQNNCNTDVLNRLMLNWLSHEVTTTQTKKRHFFAWTAMTNIYKQTEMEFSSVSGSEVPVSLKQSMPGGHQSCSDLNTASFMFNPDDSTTIIAETSLDTKTKTLNVIFKNCNAVLVGQVEQIQPMEV